MNGEKVVNNIRFLKARLGAPVPSAPSTQELTERSVYLKTGLFIFHAYLGTLAAEVYRLAFANPCQCWRRPWDDTNHGTAHE